MNFEGLFWLQHQSILGSHTVRNQVTGCYYDISNQPTHPKKAEDLYVRDPALFRKKKSSRKTIFFFTNKRGRVFRPCINPQLISQ